MKPNARMLLAIVATAIFLIISISVMTNYYPTQNPQLNDSPPKTEYGLRVDPTSPGNWTINIAGGSYKASTVWLNIIKPSTGELTVNKIVSKLAPAQKDSDAIFNDQNANSKLDAGDTIILYASGGHIIAGYKVQLIQDRNIIGTIKELPSGNMVDSDSPIKVHIENNTTPIYSEYYGNNVTRGWIVNITSGSMNITGDAEHTDIRVRIKAPSTGSNSTGKITVDAKLVTHSNGWYIFNNIPDNLSLNPGDSLFLMASGDYIRSGYTFYLFVYETATNDKELWTGESFIVSEILQ